MANYVTTADINTFLWTSGEDTLINMLNWIATSQINNYLWVSDLNSATYTNEEYDLYGNNSSFFNKYNLLNPVNPNYVYYLKQINPTSVTHINTVAIWNYKLNWRRLELENIPANTEQVFNKVKITYIAWYTTIPEDIKMVVYNLVWFMYNSRKAQGINSFTQGQLSVSYANWQKSYEEIQYILSWLWKYKKNIILS